MILAVVLLVDLILLHAASVDGREGYCCGRCLLLEIRVDVLDDTPIVVVDDNVVHCWRKLSHRHLLVTLFDIRVLESWQRV